MCHFSSGLNSKTSKIPNIMGGREYEAVHNPQKLIALKIIENLTSHKPKHSQKHSNQLVPDISLLYILSPIWVHVCQTVLGEIKMNMLHYWQSSFQISTSLIQTLKLQQI